MAELQDSDVDAIKVCWRRRGAREDEWEDQVFDWGSRPVSGDYPDENRGAVDAGFLSMAALDNFVFPYLARVHGHKMAFERRERLRNAILSGGLPKQVDLRDKGLGEADLVVVP